MIKLKNIKIDNDIISCDVYPEDSHSNGTLKLNLSSKEIIDYSLPSGYEWCKDHIQHAKNKLLDMVNENDISSEKNIMWN